MPRPRTGTASTWSSARRPPARRSTRRMPRRRRTPLDRARRRPRRSSPPAPSTPRSGTSSCRAWRRCRYRRSSPSRAPRRSPTRNAGRRAEPDWLLLAVRRAGARAGRSAGARTAESAQQLAAALDLGLFELGTRRVDALGVEDRAFAGGVGRWDLDAVFAHARRELGERLFARRAVETVRAAGEDAARKAAALLDGRFVLSSAHALRQRETAAAEEAAGARRPARFASGQCDAVLPQAFAERREAPRSGASRPARGGRRGA